MDQFRGPIRFHSRDIIIVNNQPFYRSSGHNSGLPGIWLPFDGISFQNSLWFSKNRYLQPIHRFGTQELKNISDWLSTIDIPEGKTIIKPQEVNLWINNEFTQQFNELLDYLHK